MDGASAAAGAAVGAEIFFETAFCATGVDRPSRNVIAFSMSTTGIPSVMQKPRPMPPAAASRTASGAKAAGTKTHEALAPVARTACSTVSKTGTAPSSAVSAEKKQLLDLVEGMAFLQAARSGRPTTVEVLDELARRLPDSTYVEKLSIEDDRILLIGLSNEASSLVRRMEGSPLWRSPALAGALQPDKRSGRDRFTLTAELAVAAPAATAAEDADARSAP